MVDGAGLENQCALPGTGGSNPSLSVGKLKRRRYNGFRWQERGHERFPANTEILRHLRLKMAEFWQSFYEANPA